MRRWLPADGLPRSLRRRSATACAPVSYTHLNVYIAVAHRDLGEALLLGGLAGRRELRNRADVGRLGGLTAGVGVNLGIEYHDVYILAGSEDMIQAAEADIISPAVAAEDPDGLLGQVFLMRNDFLAGVAAGSRALLKLSLIHI